MPWRALPFLATKRSDSANWLNSLFPDRSEYMYDLLNSISKSGGLTPADRKHLKVLATELRRIHPGIGEQDRRHLASNLAPSS